MTPSPKIGSPRPARGTAWRLPLWSLIALILLAPLVAMQFTQEVNWDATDFLFAGVLLIGGGALFELAAWKIHKPLWRLAVALGLLAIVLIVWADAAVGVF